MSILTQLRNVIDAGNVGVPEQAQLLRASSASCGDDCLCVESRDSLDLPFASKCLSVSVCDKVCQKDCACDRNQPAEPPAEQAAEQPAEQPLADDKSDIPGKQPAVTTKALKHRN